MKKPYTHYYENIVVSKSSGVKKKLKDRASEMGMSLTKMVEYLLDADYRTDGMSEFTPNPTLHEN